MTAILSTNLTENALIDTAVLTLAVLISRYMPYNWPMLFLFLVLGFIVDPQCCIFISLILFSVSTINISLRWKVFFMILSLILMFIISCNQNKSGVLQSVIGIPMFVGMLVMIITYYKSQHEHHEKGKEKENEKENENENGRKFSSAHKQKILNP